MGQVDAIFFKISKTARERKIIWKSQFQGFKAEQKPKNSGELFLRDLKTMLKDLKLGITNEEVDNVIDCFESSVVNALNFERRIAEGAAKIDSVNKEKDEQIRYLINEINTSIVRDRIPLERLFFEFDANSTGTMEKAQFTKMIQYLKINATKNQINVLFDDVDHDKKGYISLTELRNFMENAGLQQQLQVEKTTTESRESKINALYMKIKENVVAKGTTLHKTIVAANHRPTEAMTKGSMEKVLLDVGVVFKAEETEALYDRVLSSAGSSTCSWEDFLNFCIKNHIEVVSYDDKNHNVHPSVTVYVGKMQAIFKKLEVHAGMAFNYLCPPNRKILSKRHFIKGIQSFGMNMSRDDITLLFEYFDEKGYGEITVDTFLEKFDYLTSMSLQRVEDDGQNEGEINIKKVSSRHQVISLL